MIEYEDRCVGCPPEIGCMSNSCPNKNVPVYICDDCGDEDVELYEFEEMELCIDCVRQRLHCINRSPV